MTTSEAIQIIIAILMLLTAALTYYSSKGNNTLARKLEQGQMEISVRQSITLCSNRLSDINVEISKEGNVSKERKQQVVVAIENYLNAYDDACGLYLDNKIDQDRFKKNYSDEIRNLFTEEGTRPYLDTKSSGFMKIRKVHTEWFEEDV